MKKSLFTVVSFALGAALAYSQTPVPLNPVPARIVGHPQPEQLALNSTNPNLVEGREMWSPQAIAVDTSVTPPILYVADVGNNRVLAWKNATAALLSNGQPADLIIGQQDAFHTASQGPGHQFQTGLDNPTGLLVDSNGNLYVADSNNNRILRYPKPFANQGALFPNLYIGQPNLNSRVVNYPNNSAASPSNQGLNLGGAQVGLALDSANNLWVTDPGNRRVLRFAANDVTAGGGSQQANLEIGQLDFTSVQPPVTTATQATANVFATPAGLAFDSAGRLYVSDNASNFGRVLVFVPSPQFSNGMSASRIMGVFPSTQPATSQDQINKTVFGTPQSIFFSSGMVGVVDAGFSRILLFDSYDKWPDPNTIFSPQAIQVVGQPNFTLTTSLPNGGGVANVWSPAPTASTVANPLGAAFSGSDLYVADTSNNRVVILPFTSSTFGAATRVLGQDRFDMRAPNLIEGREFDFVSTGASGTVGDAGIALDNSSDTPHLYVSDPYNHRILGFKDYRSLKAGAHADLVLGQPDMNSGLCNITGSPDTPTQSSLCRPTGVLVDGNGDLYVADSANARVLRFPTPFAHQGTLQQADLVLGQNNFRVKITDATAGTMATPYGLAIAGSAGMLVSDQSLNRILFFPFTSNGTFSAGNDNGKLATKVLGQQDFNSGARGSGLGNLASPHHIATDSESRVYVADSANSRILIFDQLVNLPDKGATGSLALSGNGPQGVFVNQLTGEIWVADTNNNQALIRKFPKYSTLIFNPAATASVSAGANPLAVTQDQYGNVIAADISSRVEFYFPGLQGINGANFMPNRQLAPGMFASLCSQGSNCANGVALFGSQTANYSSLPNPIPLPTTLGDVQVLFNGTPTPMTYVSPTQINFIVPMGAPTGGTADVQVVQASTGRVYASAPVQMNTVSPGIFTLDFNAKFRQGAILNQDGSVNSPTNQAARGSYISIYATGQGFIPGAPPDGDIPQSLVSTPFTPRIFINTCFTDESCTLTPDEVSKPKVQFSGLSPQFPGIWQINAYIPQSIGVGPQVPIAIVAGPLGSVDPSAGFQVTVAVK